MGRAIAFGFVLILMMAGFVVAWLMTRGERKDVEVESGLRHLESDTYRELQNAVRLLEQIKMRDEDMLTGALSEAHRSQADLIIRRFYREAPEREITKG